MRSWNLILLLQGFLLFPLFGQMGFTQLNTPKDTRVFSLLTSDNIAYAATLSGVATSVDQGESWQMHNNTLSAYAVIELTIGPNGRIYALTRSSESENAGGRVWYSDDAAINWTTTFDTIPGEVTGSNRSIVIDSMGNVIVAMKKDLYVRAWNGSTWEARSPGAFAGQENNLKIYLAPDQTLYTGYRGSQLYRSFDAGLSWELINSGLNFSDMTFLGGDSILVAPLSGLFLSVDNAVSWQQIASPPSDAADKKFWKTRNHLYVSGYLDVFPGFGRYQSNRISLPLPDSLTQSSWKGVNGAPENLSAFTEINDSIQLSSSSSQPLFRTEDGGNSWDIGEAPSSSETVNAGVVHVTQTGVMLWFRPNKSDRYRRSVDDGQTWQSLPFPNNLLRDISEGSNGELLACMNELTGSTIIHSVNDGESWQTVYSGFRNSLMEETRSILITSENKWFAGSRYCEPFAKVARSIDAGANWEAVAPQLSYQTTVYDLEVDGFGRVYAAVDNQRVLRSNLNQTVWEELSAGLGALETREIEHNARGIFCLASNNTILKFNSSTESWETAMQGLNGVEVTAIVAPFALLNTVYAGATTGDVFLLNEQDEWEQVIGFPGASIRSLQVAQGNLYVLQSSYDLFVSDSLTAIDWVNPSPGPIPDPDRQPTTFRLEVNYPNPFNPSTTIPFALPESGRVRLAIYDIQGRLVHQLIDQELAAGVYDIKWFGTDNAGQLAASGVYFVRLSNGRQEAYQKLLLVR